MNVKLFIATLGLGLLVTSTADAQLVSADIHIGTGPVASRLLIGERYPSYHRSYGYRTPARFVVERHAPRRIVVERFHGGRGFERSRYHQVRVYYDGRDRYYDGYGDGLREVTLYERDGRYYRDCERNDDRDHQEYGHHSYQH
ncbi:MAG: hypothetical protein ABI613_10920 [Gemmatimonadota bacterium]